MKNGIRLVVMVASISVILVQGVSRMSGRAASDMDVIEDSIDMRTRGTTRPKGGALTTNRIESISESKRKSFELAQAGVAVAYRWALAIKNPYEKECAMEALMLSAGNLEPGECEKALKELSGLDLENPRGANLQLLLLKGWSRSNPDDALQWISSRGLSDTALIGILPEVMKAKMEKDPAEAESFVNSFPSGTVYVNAYLNLAAAMAEHDLNKAVEFASAFPDNEDVRRQCLEAVAQHFAQTSPDMALQKFAEMKESSFKSLLGVALVTVISDNDPQKGMAFAGQLDPETKNQAIFIAGEVWANGDPQGMARYVDAVEDVGQQGDMLKILADSWSESNPEEAMKWFDAFSRTHTPRDSELIDGKARAGSSIAYNILELEQQKGVEWINRLDDGPMKDSILRNVLVNNKVVQPENALSLALGISDESTRMEQGKRIVQTVFKKDPSLAAMLVEKSGASTVERNKLMNGLKSR